jgi:hypothetical protein
MSIAGDSLTLFFFFFFFSLLLFLLFENFVPSRILHGKRISFRDFRLN